jgi:rSAM/selenodomain-associated transferase 1
VRSAVGVIARAPSAQGKSRLAADLDPERLYALKVALLQDTLLALETVPDLFIFFTPDDAVQEMASYVGAVRPCVPQGDGDLGARMLRAIRDLLETRNYEIAVLVGSDIPGLTADRAREAIDTLEASGGVVLGPADDGGYYLIGMTVAHQGLFEHISWGTDSVLTTTLQAAERLGVDARLIRSAYDVDTISDVQRVERDLEFTSADACPHLRGWIRGTT